MRAKPKPTPFTRRVGALLQGQRRRCGMTQEQLAEGADLSLKYVGEIERGEANATLAALDRLACVLDWDPWYLFGRPHAPISGKVRQVLMRDVGRAKTRLQSALAWLRALDPTEATSLPPGEEAV